jgi:hypothetical protein
MRFCRTPRTQVGPPQADLIGMRSVIQVHRVDGAKLVIIVRAGFCGLATAIRLSIQNSLRVMMLVEQSNHPLVQPSLDQVANHG